MSTRIVSPPVPAKRSKTALMLRSGQDDDGSKDKAEGDAADEQDEAEPASLVLGFECGPNRAPLLWRVRGHADQHSRYRRSAVLPTRLSAAGVTFMALGTFFLGGVGGRS